MVTYVYEFLSSLKNLHAQLWASKQMRDAVCFALD